MSTAMDVEPLTGGQIYREVFEQADERRKPPQRVEVGEGEQQKEAK